MTMVVDVDHDASLAGQEQLPPLPPHEKEQQQQQRSTLECSSMQNSEGSQHENSSNLSSHGQLVYHSHPSQQQQQQLDAFQTAAIAAAANLAAAHSINQNYNPMVAGFDPAQLLLQQAGLSFEQQQQQQQELQIMIHRQQQQQQQLSNLLLSSAASSSGLAGLPTTHNLIPIHLQASSMAPSLHGTPGHQPALIPNSFMNSPCFLSETAALLAAAATSPASCPILTVQDRPLVPPVYNGVNPHYPGLRLLHSCPPIFVVDNFLTPFECEFLVHVASDSFGPAPVVGKGSGEISPSRTSSTSYLAREDVPDYMRKVAWLTGKPIEHCELPQVGRYLPTQQYLQHYDAFDLSNEDGRRFCSNGGQRTVTVLVYLNDVREGGATHFPALSLQVQPRQGMALIFFPATIDGFLDKMALHAALPAIDPKFVSQVWIRQGEYKGQPSKRLSQTLGVPFSTVPSPQAATAMMPMLPSGTPTTTTTTTSPPSFLHPSNLASSSNNNNNDNHGLGLH